jgi:hypothetical protein
MRNVYKILIGKPERKRPIRRPKNRTIKGKWLLRKEGGMVWIRFIWLRIGTSGVLL